MRKPSNDAYLGNDLISIVRGLMPNDWRAEVIASVGGRAFDGTLEIAPPKGPPSRFVFELKGRVEPRDVDRFAHLSVGLTGDERLLIFAPYFSARSRQLLKQHDISYVDPTGNARLASDSLLIDRTGSDKSPKNDAERGARTSLRGPVTGRVIRFLCDTRSPFKVRQIAAQTEVNPGNVSRILDLLERERLVERSTGSVSSVDWQALIERWATDLQRDRRAESFLEPHGVDVLTSRLADASLPYAITGSFASAQLAPAAVPIAIDVYVQDIEEARAALSLRRSDRIGNVRLIEAFDRVVFERTIVRADVVLASPAQVAADLRTLPARSSEEYLRLIEWMKRHESIWQR